MLSETSGFRFPQLKNFKICYFRFIRIRFKSLKQLLVKLIQILLPFHGKQLFFSRVALLAAGCHVAPGAFAAPGYRDNVIHRQLFRRRWPTAIVAHTFCQAAFPPLGIPKFPCFLARSFQILFAQVIGEWRDGFFSFHFWCFWAQRCKIGFDYTARFRSASQFRISTSNIR